jgi:hypothetical protein
MELEIPGTTTVLNGFCGCVFGDSDQVEAGIARARFVGIEHHGGLVVTGVLALVVDSTSQVRTKAGVNVITKTTAGKYG